MSYQFPLLFDARTDFGELGSQFHKIQELDRDRGLLLPDQGGFGQRDPEIRDVTKTSIEQLPDRKELLPEDESLQGLTMLQAQQNVVDETRSRELTAEEKSDHLSSDIMLDPRIEDAIRQEARRGGSNMFSEIPDDFIDDMQLAVQAHEKERNLYNQLVKSKKKKMLDDDVDQAQGDESVLATMVEKLFEMQQKQQAQP